MIEDLNKLIGNIAVYSHEIHQHSLNVGFIAARIAKLIGLTETESSLIQYSGFLHDIGKIQITLSVLNKPGKLTAQEWSIVKKHPEYGVDILSFYTWAEPILQMVQYHHERWDGNGYFGVHGEDLPLGARILAIADAFDAMTSSRPYQKTMSWMQSLQELEICAGTQFDPDLTERIIRSPDKVFIKRGV